MTETDHDIRCEWGEEGLRAARGVIIIVDVLSFSTCVDVATARGATIVPYGRRDDAAEMAAMTVGAELALPRGQGRYSLSPSTYGDVPEGAKILLPAPNGGALSRAAPEGTVLTGCLRNADAVARAAAAAGGPISIVPAGERRPDGTWRTALEDLLGAGAISYRLSGLKSPSARAAEATFRACKSDLPSALLDCVSGHELIALGYEKDVHLAAGLNVSETAPILEDGAYIHRTSR
jgi:2-phosphosulfolactate phosphatase